MSNEKWMISDDELINMNLSNHRITFNIFVIPRNSIYIFQLKSQMKIKNSTFLSLNFMCIVVKEKLEIFFFLNLIRKWESQKVLFAFQIFVRVIKYLNHVLTDFLSHSIFSKSSSYVNQNCLTWNHVDVS